MGHTRPCPRLSDPNITAMEYRPVGVPAWPVQQSVRYYYGLSDKVSNILLFIILLLLLLVKSLFDSGDKSSSDSLSHLLGFPPGQQSWLSGEERAWSISDRELCDKSLASCYFFATGKGWIRTDARPDKSTFAFCLQAVKNQGFSLPIQSQYSFWSKHFN